MVESERFEDRLAELLEAQAQQIEAEILPELKQQFRQMRSSFEAIHNVLKKKALLKADPYNYEERVSELDTPSDDPYLESEKDVQISTRLSQYHARIEYLTDYYDCSIENLDLIRLKALTKFIKYLNWRNLSETATQPTTRGLAEQIVKIKRSSDALSVNIVNDAHEQLNRASVKINNALKKIARYQRETYKLEVRRTILTEPSIPAAPAPSEMDRTARKIKSAFPRRLPGRPFARELIFEIFNENAAEGGEALRRNLLHDLAVERAPAEEKRAGADLRPLLLDAARVVASCSRPFEEGAKKLSDNALVVENRKLTFGEMLRHIWDHVRGRDRENHVYTVDYLDEATNARRSEDIHFEEFINLVSRRARIYNGILRKTGNAWNKLNGSSEDVILNFVTKDIQDAYEIARRFESLDTFFRAEVTREQRAQLRGINVELTTIKDNLVRARKKAHQYVAKSEEIAQLKKLGITEA